MAPGGAAAGGAVDVPPIGRGAIFSAATMSSPRRSHVGRPSPGQTKHGPATRRLRRGLADVIDHELAVVFCGINPGLTAAAEGLHFVSATNRFWLVLHRAGFTPMQIPPKDHRHILRYRCGLTVAVTRATPAAADVSRSEMRDARAALEKKIRRYAPRVVAFLGKAAFAAMTDDPKVPWGRQVDHFGGAVAWVLPNPSGRNRSFRTEALVQAYGALRAYVEAAGWNRTSDVSSERERPCSIT